MVIWSGPAKKSLKEIYNFIADDSDYYAIEVIDQIIKETDNIPAFPYLGRVVPEINNINIRELISYSYRIIYEIAKDEIHILNIIHCKRKLTEEKLY